MMQRAYFQEIKNRVKEPRKFIQVLYDPRQVGSSGDVWWNRPWEPIC